MSVREVVWKREREGSETEWVISYDRGAVGVGSLEYEMEYWVSTGLVSQVMG